MVSRNEILEKLAEFFPGGGYDERWVAFSKIIARTAAAEEREACAKLCDELYLEDYEEWLKICAESIRARSNT